MRLRIDEPEALSCAIAHDVRGPLRHIDGFARVLGDRPGVIDTEPASLNDLQRIRAPVLHPSDIAEGPLAFSRASRAEMHLERCDTRARVDDLLQERVPELDGRKLDIGIGELPLFMLQDLHMPHMGGFAMLTELGADEDIRALPVIIMSSSKEDPDLRRGCSLGINASVVKPVDFDQCSRTVRQTGVFWALINEPPPVL